MGSEDSNTDPAPDGSPADDAATPDDGTAAPGDPSTLRNIMLTMAYDGSGYRGWQVQPNGDTVQARLEAAIHSLTGETLRVFCAGRTDSGVHALGQVASFKTRSKIAAGQFRRGLQRFLPPDVTVIAAREVHAQFHATFSAVRKRYRYLLDDGYVSSPFLRGKVTTLRQRLNVAAMQQAVPHLLGRHDFRCFETQWPNKATSVRTIMEAAITRIPHWSMWNARGGWIPTDPRAHEDLNSPLICFEIMADGFLYNMVRAIVGTLLEVGTGRQPPEYVRDVIRSLDRGTAGSTAPADGLYLMQVDYPEILMDPLADIPPDTYRPPDSPPPPAAPSSFPEK